MNRLSLRDRVTLASTGVLALALVLVSVAGNLLLSRRFSADAEAALRNRAAAQLATLDLGGSRIIVRDAPSDQVLDEQSWVFQGGQTVERPRATADLQRAATALAASEKPRFVNVSERVKLYALPIRGDSGDRLGTIVVGISLRPYEHAERLWRGGTLLLDLAALLLGATVVRWAVGRTLRPVEEMTERASEWSEHDLHRRFGLGEPFDEITGLAATLDRLLERIDGALRREQQLTAEIAHELRTPLSGVRAEAELALRGARPETAEALRRIIDGTDRMNDAIETLLAAHVGDSRRGQTCGALATANDVAEIARPVAESRGVTIVVEPSATDVRVEADAGALAQTLAPLVDNALRHAASEVRLSVEQRAETAVIGVRDDGPGIAESELERIFDAGVSLEGGAGLGLPLARRLARSYGAELDAHASTAGGRFELRVPTAGRRL